MARMAWRSAVAMAERSPASRWAWVRRWLPWARAMAWRSRPVARSPAARVRPPGRRTPRASIPGSGEEDRCAEAFGVLRAEAFDVVLLSDIDATWPELRIGKGRVHEVAALDRHHSTRHAVADEVDGDVRECDGDRLIERVGVAAAKVVRELARDGLLAGAFADLVGERLRDVRLVPVPEGVGRPVLRDRSAGPHRAFRSDDEGVARRVVALVLGQDGDEPVEIEW